MENNNTALNGVKMMIADGIVTQEAAEKYFPELKESEDEKILRVLKKGFQCYKNDEWCDGITNSQILAWLEKQGEQKPDEKVEPKFKAGDFVVDKDGRIYQITRIEKDFCHIAYACSLVENPMFWFLYLEREIRKWTIQDAKDGDVLVTPLPKECEAGVQIFLFKEINSRWYAKNCVEFYCRVCQGVFKKPNETVFMGKASGTFYPATKEQRDVLFSKMKEAGYEWDAEKLELKKIEPIDEYEGLTDFEKAVADACIGFIGKELGWKQYVKDNADNLLKIAVKKFNAVQDDTTIAIKNEEAYKIGFSDGEAYTKEEMTSTWSEEDEGICRAIINDIANDKSMCAFEISKGICDEQINWLKSLKERVACEANFTTTKEWSKEDERTYKSITYSFAHNYPLTVQQQEFVKSLKDRYTWKPSEEQMKMLENVRKILHTNKDIYSKANNLMYNFEELIRTLKKLREE